MNQHQKNIRKTLHIWSYADLIEKIKYKAKLEGVPVVDVSPRNTSKTCSRCGYVNRRLKNDRIFVCPKCGLKIDRDLDASINLARKVALTTSPIFERSEESNENR
ncbi:transposase [Methanocaldococcus sp.]